MANPFGSSDESLSKNTGHTNQANLVYAMIPRGANKWREVINGADVTPTASGNYDSDGYWRSSNTTGNFAEYVIASPLNSGDPRTVITSVRYNSGGGGSGTNQHAGLWNDTGYTASSGLYFFRLQHYSREYQGRIFDSVGSNAAGLVASNYNPGADTSGIFLRGNDATPLYEAYHRVTGSNTAMGSSTTTTISTSDAILNRVGVRVTNKWAVQFVFVYNTVLSDTDVNAIIDDPGSVITYTSAGGVPKSTRLTLLGVG